MAMGRPRAFDVDKALDRALEVFWRKGYEGTSLPDLTEAMGINRPSLYAAFGNKESLFRKVLQRYTDEHMAFIGAALIEVIRNGLLMAGVDANWQGAFVGLFIVLAVYLERIRGRTRA